jgi:hypothetical protein
MGFSVINVASFLAANAAFLSAFSRTTLDQGQVERGEKWSEKRSLRSILTWSKEDKECRRDHFTHASLTNAHKQTNTRTRQSRQVREIVPNYR